VVVCAVVYFQVVQTDVGEGLHVLLIVAIGAWAGTANEANILGAIGEICVKAKSEAFAVHIVGKAFHSTWKFLRICYDCIIGRPGVD
jgi:hypothetical protein